LSQSTADHSPVRDGSLAGVSPQKRRKVRWLFILFALFLVFQGAVLGVVEEPYPAFRLPDFRGSPDQGGYVEIDTPTLSVDFADGSATVADTLVFAGADAPDALVALVFPESAPQPTGAGLAARIRQSLDSFGVFKESRSSAPQTAQWLRYRLAELFPGRTPVRFQVHWRRDRFTLAGVRVWSRSLSTVAVPLTT
jgi:hypothetical protein